MRIPALEWVKDNWSPAVPPMTTGWLQNSTFLTLVYHYHRLLWTKVMENDRTELNACSLFINSQYKMWLLTSYSLVVPPDRKPTISRMPQTSSFWSPKSVIRDPSIFLTNPQPHVQTFLSPNDLLFPSTLFCLLEYTLVPSHPVLPGQRYGFFTGLLLKILKFVFHVAAKVIF